MTIRITGMNSGLDTDSIVQELVSAYRAKGDKYTKAQTKLSWTQDVWKSLNTKIFNFYKSLDSLRLSSNVSKKTTVSDSTKATITASSNAVSGTQTLEITEMAKSGYVTGGKLNELSKNPSLAELGYSRTSGKITVEGKEGKKEITVSAATTVDDFVKQVNESGTGISAKYENGRISFSTESGGFKITGSDSNGTSALNVLGISKVQGSKATSLVGKEVGTASQWDGNTTLSALGLGASEEIKIKDSNGNIKTINFSGTDTIDDFCKAVNESDAGVKVDFKEGTQKFIFTSIDEGKDTDFEIMGDNAVLSKLGLDQGAVKVDGADGVLTGTELKSGVQLPKEGKFTSSSTLSQLGYNINDGRITISGGSGSKTIEVSSSTTINDFVKQINESGTGVKASFDAENQRIFLFSEKTGKEGDIKITGDANGNVALGMLKLNESSGANIIQATDAKIKLNGAEYTSSSNTIKVNGLTIQAQGLTNGAITITTDTDVQGMYDKIKNFISDYNSLINEMSSLYNADSSKGYEPLTSDEKEAMSDSDIAEWEKKIKDSLLRRDNTLSGIMSAMTTAMSSSVTVNGKSYSLSSLGIKTLGYFSSGKNDKNAYHIDGDSDDENTANNTDKLMEMLTSDPEAVTEIIKGITSNLYKNLDAKMKSTTLRSAYTVYNDKEMAKSYSDYTTTIKNWNKKVEEIEDSYYKKFSAMETALAKLQSQMSSFTSMLG